MAVEDLCVGWAKREENQMSGGVVVAKVLTTVGTLKQR